MAERVEADPGVESAGMMCVLRTGRVDGEFNMAGVSGG